MIRDAFRSFLAQLIGGFVAAGAAFALFFLLVISLGYGFLHYALPVGVYLFLLLVIGIATALKQRWARLTLSLLLPLQACGLVLYVIYKTPRPGQVCDLSCYVMPLEAIAPPVVLSFIAAWMAYPGWLAKEAA